MNPTLESKANFNKLGEVQLAQGNLAGAQASFEESRQISDRLAAADPTNAQWQRDLGVSHQRIGYLLAQHGQPEKGMRELAAARDLLRELLHTNRGGAVLLQDLLKTLGLLAAAAKQSGEPGQPMARAALEETLALFEQIGQAAGNTTEVQAAMQQLRDEIAALDGAGAA